MNQSEENEERESEDDDIHEIDESVITVDLANTKISIPQDLQFDNENDMISETIVYFKNALIATIDELKCTIELLKGELEEKTYTFAHYYYGMRTTGEKLTRFY